MEIPKFAVPCPGDPCPLQHKPASHSHMPEQELLGNNLTIDPEAEELALKMKTFNGLAGDEDEAWEAVEFARMETEFQAMGNAAINSTTVLWNIQKTSDTR